MKISSGYETPQYRELVQTVFVVAAHCSVFFPLTIFANAYIYSTGIRLLVLLGSIVFIPFGLASVMWARSGRGFYISKDNVKVSARWRILMQILMAHIGFLGIYCFIRFMGDVGDWFLQVKPGVNFRAGVFSLVCFGMERIFRHSKLGGVPVWKVKK